MCSKCHYLYLSTEQDNMYGADEYRISAIVLPVVIIVDSISALPRLFVRLAIPAAQLETVAATPTLFVSLLRRDQGFVFLSVYPAVDIGSCGPKLTGNLPPCVKQHRARVHRPPGSKHVRGSTPFFGFQLRRVCSLRHSVNVWP